MKNEKVNVYECSDQDLVALVRKESEQYRADNPDEEPSEAETVVLRLLVMAEKWLKLQEHIAQ